MKMEQDFNQELKSKFLPKKRLSRKVAAVYHALGDEGRAKKVYNCSDVIEVVKLDTGEIKLSNVHFCKDQFCPLCAWRKELKMYNQCKKVVDHIKKDEYSFIFITLTVRNCKCDPKVLKATINDMNKGYNKLIRRSCYKSAFKGVLKTLEVTYDGDKLITPSMYKRKKEYYVRHNLRIGDPNPTFDTLHPHFHLLVAVPKNYFTSELYIKQEDLLQDWAEVCNLAYAPSVRIQKVTNKKISKKGKVYIHDFSSAVAELAKYPVKCTDYLKYDNETNKKVLNAVSVALYRVKMFIFTGVLKQARQELQLSDIDDDLLNIDDDDIKNGKPLYLMRFVYLKGEYVNDNVRFITIDILVDDPPDPDVDLIPPNYEKLII